MAVILSVLAVAMCVLLVLLEASQPARSGISLFELRRRKAAHDKKAAEILRREELLAQLSSLKAPATGLLLIGLVLSLIHLFDWGRAIVVSVMIVLLYGRIASFKAVRRLASRAYRRHEARLLAFMGKHYKKVGLMVGRKSLSQPTAPLGSREELVHLLEVSHIFSEEDKRLLESALSFSDHAVGDAMVRHDRVVTVKPDELLGPLVLDDLHKTKHEIFPVEKNDEVVGMLDIRDHTALKRKESVYVRDVMHAGVVRVGQVEPLDEALRVLVAAKQPYLIVVDDNQQFVGLLGLGDVVRKLTGWTRR